MHKKLYVLILSTIFLVEPISILIVDVPPGLASHKTTKNGSYKGKRDKHESGPQLGLKEKKRQNFVGKLTKKIWKGRGQAGKRRSRPK
jgi:hypothetical protein